MIIDDFDVLWTLRGPPEANSPLVVDPNAVLAGPISSQGFEPVTWRHAKIGQLDRRIEHVQFPQGDG
jgi:hypothetical protein